MVRVRVRVVGVRVRVGVRARVRVRVGGLTDEREPLLALAAAVGGHEVLLIAQQDLVRGVRVRVRFRVM